MDHSNIQYKVGAIVVLFHPNIDIMIASIKSLIDQVDEICIIDNTPNQDIGEKFSLLTNVKYIPLSTNQGIAAAQNIGIQYLQKKKVDFVLFCDQDSEASNNIVLNLLKDYAQLKQNGYNIGLIGPLPINKKTLKPYGNKNKYLREIFIADDTYIESESIISSFSLIPISLFNEIGLYRELLFIDFVENEWCFRLREQKHLSSYISKRLTIKHELGQSKRFLGLTISISTPFRIYYQVRNYIWLHRLSYVPTRWKKQVFRKLILKFIYYFIIPNNRLTYMKRMYKGIKDGLRTKLSS